MPIVMPTSDPTVWIARSGDGYMGNKGNLKCCNGTTVLKDGAWFRTAAWVLWKMCQAR